MLVKCRGCLREVPAEALKCPYCGWLYPATNYTICGMIGWVPRLIPILRDWIRGWDRRTVLRLLFLVILLIVAFCIIFWARV